MTDNTKRILELVAQNKISVDEAQKLLDLVEKEHTAENKQDIPETGKTWKDVPKYLRVVVEPAGGDHSGSGSERVNIRVPVALIRAGMKLTSLIPSDAVEKANVALKEKGIDMDLNKIKAADIEPLIDALSELEIEVNDEKKVRVYME
jgi:hypothetical protein